MIAIGSGKWIGVVLLALVSLVAIIAIVGCDEPATPASAPGSKPAAAPRKEASSSKPPAAPVEKVRIEFASSEEAVDALIVAADGRRSKDYLAAQDFLQSRRDEIVPTIAPRLERSDLSPAAQVGLVRQLAFAGEPAAAPLEAMTAPSIEAVVRHNAIEQLSRIEPPSPRAATVLRRILLEGPDVDRVEALDGLERMKFASPEFAAELRAIMASEAPEDLRKKASDALGRVDPRKTFEDRD